MGAPQRFGNSNTCGPLLRPELKSSDFDQVVQVVIHGRAEKPVYFFINEGEVEVMDAEAIRGRNFSEADVKVKEVMGPSEAHMVAISPAREKLVSGTPAS